jgi:hypothetical protein
LTRYEIVTGESKVIVFPEIADICFISLVGLSQLENQHPALLEL